MFKRICFYGAPGAGKTTLTHDVFVSSKKSKKNCEVVSELAREWAYLNRPIQSMDQVFLFASQLHREDTLLSRSKVDFVITDSPIILNSYYGYKCDPGLYDSYISFARRFDEKYPALHFFCPVNPSYKFDTEGRFHSAEDAKKISEEMLNYLYTYLNPSELTILSNENRLDTVLEILAKNKIM